MRLHLVLVGSIALLAGCAAAPSSPETGGSADEVNGAETTAKKIVLKETDSEEASLFLGTFVESIRRLADRDIAGHADGASFEGGTVKIERADGTIECVKIDKCTFDLKKVAIVDGNPVIQGNHYSWAGQLAEWFERTNAEDWDPLGVDAGQYPEPTPGKVILGRASAVPRITCERVGEAGLNEVHACTFHFEK